MDLQNSSQIVIYNYVGSFPVFVATLYVWIVCQTYVCDLLPVDYIFGLHLFNSVFGSSTLCSTTGLLGFFIFIFSVDIYKILWSDLNNYHLRKNQFPTQILVAFYVPSFCSLWSSLLFQHSKSPLHAGISEDL